MSCKTLDQEQIRKTNAYWRSDETVSNLLEAVFEATRRQWKAR